MKTSTRSPVEARSCSVRTAFLAATLALTSLALLSGCRGGGLGQGEPAATTRAGDLELRIWLEPDPPKLNTTLRLELLDGQGMPLEGADLSAGWRMAAMGSMPEMKGEAGVEEIGSGVYRAKLDLQMTGTWRLPVVVKVGGSTLSAEYSLNVGTPGLRELSASGQAGAARPTAASPSTGLWMPETRYTAPVLDVLRTTTELYDRARGHLVVDQMAELGEAANVLEQSLAKALVELPNETSPAIEALLAEANQAAHSLSGAQDLEAARSAFGELSRTLIPLVAADSRLADGLEVFSCPMTDTFPKWMQKGGDLANPYMGSAMPSCGIAADWSVEAPVSLEQTLAHAEQVHPGGEGGEVAHYTCSMHTSVKRDQPGTCPICSMDLVPVTHEELRSGTFVVGAARRQEIGVRTEAVRSETMTERIRAVGRVVYDETRLSEVTVKYKGWIGRLLADQTGERVRRGQVLFELYSPELYATQEELLAALDSQREARESAAPERADYLVEAAKQRLRLWDLSDQQIDGIARSGKPIRYLPILSPTSGHVIEKNVVEGSPVSPGQILYRIGGLDRVWIEAEIYESELPMVEIGQHVEVTLPYLPGRRFEGKVDFLYPYLDRQSRTGRVRVSLPNPRLELKPEMYANVELIVELGERLTVPEAAVLYAGERRVVFVDLGEGRLQPRAVEVGVRSGDRIEVLSGLVEGEIVVASGNFLIAAESRLKSAMEKW